MAIMAKGTNVAPMVCAVFIIKFGMGTHLARTVIKNITMGGKKRTLLKTVLILTDSPLPQLIIKTPKDTTSKKEPNKS